MNKRITNDRIIIAMGESVNVIDEITGLEMPIFKFALERGEDAALRKLDEMPVKKDIEPPADNSPKPARLIVVRESAVPPSEAEMLKKQLESVEYKENYLGGKKAIQAKLYNRARSCKSLQNPTTLLFYLIQHSAWEGKNDKHNTFKHWYEKERLIVASRSQEQISKDLGVSVRTVQRWLDELEQDRLIHRDTEGKENVYILGKVVGSHEVYYYHRSKDEDFCKIE